MSTKHKFGSKTIAWLLTFAIVITIVPFFEVTTPVALAQQNQQLPEGIPATVSPEVPIDIPSHEREIFFTGREWSWTADGGGAAGNPGGAISTTAMDQGAGQIGFNTVGGNIGPNAPGAFGNGFNPFQIGAENARSRYFLYHSREQALDLFTLYPFGRGDDFEDFFNPAPSNWMINLNSETQWSFRFDRAPRYRVWPQSDAVRVNGGTNPIFGLEGFDLLTGAETEGANGTGVAAVARNSRFPLGVWGFDTSETYTQVTTDLNQNPRSTVMNGWNTQVVPGIWQMNWNPDGSFVYDRIIYTNQPIPWAGQYGNWTQIPNTATGNQNASAILPRPPEVYNGVGTYQRDFVIPESWNDRRIFLNLDGADSFYVWVNGVPVGFSECKFTHTEFDITDALNIRAEYEQRAGIAGTHTVSIQLIRWAVGSNFEIQDFVRLSGIFRSVYLMARNTEDIWDFQVDTRPMDPAALHTLEQNTDWTFHMRTTVRDFSDHLRQAGESLPVRFELIDPNGNIVGSGQGTGEYVIHTTYLGRDSFRGRFGDGVRWHAGAADRTAIGNQTPWVEVNPHPHGTPGPAGTPVGAQARAAFISHAQPAEFIVRIPASEIQLWSPENPNLYQLVVWVEQENPAHNSYTSIKVGFRYIEYSRGTEAFGGRMFINGRRVTFYGTNAHELNPWYGHTMPLGIIRRDITLMKQHNMNALRMAHYPHDARYYDLANIYGLFIMDEANIEVHFAGHGTATNITNRAFTGPIIRDRQLNMLERTKNYPSVVIWSHGNESGVSAQTVGYTLHVLEKREADITGRGRGFIDGQPHWGVVAASNNVAGRPTHSEWGDAGRTLGQLWSQMYPPIDGWSQQGGAGGAFNAHNPVINCELAHLMNQSGGNFDSWVHIAASRNHDLGVFVWDWVDQAILAPFPSRPSIHGRPAIEGIYDEHGYPEWIFTFGGNWGDERTDGIFMTNGVLFADRTPKPHASEIGHQYQHIRTRQDGTPTNNSIGITVLNRFMFTNANNFDMSWDITENGRVIRSGSGVFDVAPVPPGRGANSGPGSARFTHDKFTEENFTINFEEITPLSNAEYHFNIRFHLRERPAWISQEVWAENGGTWVISRNQIHLDSMDFLTFDAPNPPLSVAGMTITGSTAPSNTGEITITGPGEPPIFIYVFDKAEGVFTSMTYRDQKFMESGPEPSFFRAVSDNEQGIGGRQASIGNWANAGTARTRGNTSITVSEAGNTITITAPFTNADRNMNEGNQTVYTIFPNGEVNVEQTFSFGAAVNHLVEIGTRMRLSPGLDNVTYFGRGPEENYVDRRWANDVAVWETTVADMFTPYQRTQFMGNRIDTRWTALTRDDGSGVLVTAGDFRPQNVFRGTAPAFNPNQIPRNADSLFEFYALYYTQQELNSPGSRLPRQPERLFAQLDRPNAAGAGNPIYLNINLASWGVGGDQSWGADAHAVYQINWANSAYTYNFTIRPISNFDYFNVHGSREIRNLNNNVRDLLERAREMGITAQSPAYIAAQNLLPNAPVNVAADVFYNLMADMAVINPVVNFATVRGVSAVPNVNNLIHITLPPGANIEAIQPVFETFGTGVTVAPTGPQDFTLGPIVFTFTQGELSSEYTLIIETQEEARSITSFVLAGVEGEVSYDNEGNGVIFVDLSLLTDVNLYRAPDSIVFTGQSVSPGATVVRDFGQEQVYVVTATSGLTRQYTIIAVDSNTPFIRGATAFGGMVPLTVNRITNTLSLVVPYSERGILQQVPVDFDANGHSEDVHPWPSANMTMTELLEEDVYYLSFTINVSVADRTRTYTMIVTLDEGDRADILAFSLDLGPAFGIAHGVVNNEAGTVNLTVPHAASLENVLPTLTLSLGATLYDPWGEVSFVPGVPMTFIIDSGNAMVRREWAVMVTRGAPVIASLDPEYFLEGPGGVRATELVFATTPGLGAAGLPSTVNVLSDTGEPMIANVAWDSVSFPLYQTVSLGGWVSVPGSNQLRINALVEVVHADTVVWINAGTMRNSNVPAYANVDIGSVLFEAVSEFLGNQLLNETSDQQGSPDIGGQPPTATWGHKFGEGSTNLTMNRRPNIRGGQSFMSHKDQTGHFTGNQASNNATANGNQIGNNIEYRLPLLGPGHYTIAVASAEWWNGRTMTVTVQERPGLITAENSALLTIPGLSVQGVGAAAHVVGNFVLEEEAMPIVRLTGTGSQAPVITWIQVFPAAIDRTQLGAVIAQAQALDAENFTVQSWANMQAMLLSAIGTYNNESATQAMLNTALNNLRNAIDELVFALPMIVRIDPEQFLIGPNDVRATGLVFATTPQLGIDGLPETILVINEENESIEADVVWNVPPGTNPFPLRGTVSVTGTAIAQGHANTLPISAIVEVVNPGTVIWINGGTMENPQTANAVNVGSVLFDAVSVLLGEQLINEVPDQPGYPLYGNPEDAIWGHKWGEGNENPVHNRRVGNRTTAVQYMSGKNFAGLFAGNQAIANIGAGANALNNNFEYRLPLLPAGTYSFAINATEWYGQWDSRTVRVDILNGSGVNAPILTTLGPSVVQPAGVAFTGVAGDTLSGQAGTTFTGTFTLAESAMPIIRVTNTAGADGNLAWIQVDYAGLCMYRFALAREIALAERLDEEIYTASSWQAMLTSLNSAIGILGNEHATTEMLVAALYNLRAAIRALIVGEDEDPEVFEITFDLNFEDAGVHAVAKTQVGGTITIADWPTVPTRDDFVFVGWFTERTGGVVVTVATVFSADTRIFAQWTEEIDIPPVAEFSASNPARLAQLLTEGDVVLSTPGNLGIFAHHSPFVIPAGRTLTVTTALNVQHNATLIIEGTLIVADGGRINNQGSADPDRAGTIIIAPGGRLINYGHVENVSNSTVRNHGVIVNNQRFEVRARTNLLSTVESVIEGSVALNVHRDANVGRIDG